jgi:hypothetical protein
MVQRIGAHRVTSATRLNRRSGSGKQRGHCRGNAWGTVAVVLPTAIPPEQMMSGSPLISMSHLAETRRNQGDLQGARDLREQTLATRRRVLGNDHPDTLLSMHGLAAIHQDLGDQQGARQLFEQTLAGYRRVLGNDHPNTLSTMSNLAAARQALGDPQSARDLHDQVLTTRRRVLGKDHPTLSGLCTASPRPFATSATFKAPATCTSRLSPPASAFSATTTPTR